MIAYNSDNSLMNNKRYMLGGKQNNLRKKKKLDVEREVEFYFGKKNVHMLK